MLEIEAKIKVDDLQAIKEKLLALGCQVEKDFYREQNIFYDFPDQRLTKNKQALRLRVIGKKAFLTFKGQPLQSRSFKIREELETEIKNFKHFKKILKKLGLKQIFEYRKKRMLLRKDRVKICLDESEAGCFMELEGKRSDLVRLARQLGFSRKDFLTTDYVQMIKAVRESNYSSSSSNSSSSSSNSSSNSSSSSASSSSKPSS